MIDHTRDIGVARQFLFMGGCEGALALPRPVDGSKRVSVLNADPPADRTFARQGTRSERLSVIDYAHGAPQAAIADELNVRGGFLAAMTITPHFGIRTPKHH